MIYLLCQTGEIVGEKEFVYGKHRPDNPPQDLSRLYKEAVRLNIQIGADASRQENQGVYPPQWIECVPHTSLIDPDRIIYQG